MTARLVLPSADRDAIQVVMARDIHGDFDTSDQVTFYFDRYTGRLLGEHDARDRTAGDVVMAWIGPLHVGSFGGIPLKVAWAVLALCLPGLALSGVAMWWNRVVAERRWRRSNPRASPDEEFRETSESDGRPGVSM